MEEHPNKRSKPPPPPLPTSSKRPTARKTPQKTPLLRSITTPTPKLPRHHPDIVTLAQARRLSIFPPSSGRVIVQKELGFRHTLVPLVESLPQQQQQEEENATKLLKEFEDYLNSFDSTNDQMSLEDDPISEHLKKSLNQLDEQEHLHQMRLIRLKKSNLPLQIDIERTCQSYEDIIKQLTVILQFLPRLEQISLKLQQLPEEGKLAIMFSKEHQQALMRLARVGDRVLPQISSIRASLEWYAQWVMSEEENFLSKLQHFLNN